MACTDTSRPHQFLNSFVEYEMPINSDTKEKSHKRHVCVLAYSYTQYHILFQIEFHFPSCSYDFLLSNHNYSHPSRRWDSQTHTTLLGHVLLSILCSEYCFWWPCYCDLHLKEVGIIPESRNSLVYLPFRLVLHR